MMVLKRASLLILLLAPIVSVLGADLELAKAVIVADELPRTSTGKIRKNVVRETHAGHYEPL